MIIPCRRFGTDSLSVPKRRYLIAVPRGDKISKERRTYFPWRRKPEIISSCGKIPNLSSEINHKPMQMSRLQLFISPFISFREVLFPVSCRSSFSILCLTTDPIHQGHEKRRKSVTSARSPRNNVRAATRSKSVRGSDVTLLWQRPVRC